MSGSSPPRVLALLPFGYTVVTRLRSVRDCAFLIASSWVPAYWFLFRTAHTSPDHALLEFALGYLAFIAVYEIGYLANDCWDAAKSENGRRRLSFALGPAFVASFIGIRLGIWAAVAVLTGWYFDPVWLIGFAALAIVLAEHNLLTAPGLRSASFFQLAVLRFTLPVLAPTLPGDRLVLLIVAILYYVYLRFLSYLESKDLLRIPERRRPMFAVTQIGMLLPLAAMVSLLTNKSVVLELWAYFLACYAGWALLKQRQA